MYKLFHLQDWYNDALKKYYNEQNKQIPLLENIAKLEHKVKDLDQVTHVESSLLRPIIIFI